MYTSSGGRVNVLILQTISFALRRASYLALLDEQPQAQARLIDLGTRSAFLAERVARRFAESAGVAVLPGTVERLTANRLPHMGWNQLSPPSHRAGMFAGLGVAARDGRPGLGGHVCGGRGLAAAGGAAGPGVDPPVGGGGQLGRGHLQNLRSHSIAVCSHRR